MAGDFEVDEVSGVFFSHSKSYFLSGDQVILDGGSLEKKRIPIMIEMEGFYEYGQK